MKNISHEKVWRYQVVQIHVEPRTISLIKINIDMNSDKNYVEIKLCRNFMSENSDMYEFKMALFDKWIFGGVDIISMKLQETYWHIINYDRGWKIQFTHTLLYGEPLHEFVNLYDQIWNMATRHLNQDLLGWVIYLPSINAFSKQRRAMRHRMSKTCEFKVSHYAARMFELNEYFDFLLGQSQEKKWRDGIEWNHIAKYDRWLYQARLCVGFWFLRCYL